jgi:hypothetical protein
MVGRTATPYLPAFLDPAESLHTDLCYDSQTDRRATVDGAFGRPRHHSPSSEAHSAHFQSSLGSDVSTASGHPRRRSSRARPATDVASNHSSRAWLGANEDDIYKAKRGQTNPRRAVNDPSVASSEVSSSDIGKDAGAFLPKLGRIPEGKENKTPRRRRGSTVSSMEGQTPARRINRSLDAVASRNRSARQKNNSLQRVERNLANLENPSLISVLSGLTQQSNASNESNSTITQQSYDKKLIAKRKPIKSRGNLSAKRPGSKREPADMASLQPSVFQYMDSITGPDAFNAKQHQSSHSSSASSSSNGSEHGDLSSTTEEPVVESPPTSPASMRRPNVEDSEEDEETDSESHASARRMLQPSVSEATNDSEGQDEEAEEEDESSSDSEEEQASKASTVARSSRRESPTNNMALERVPPPRVPSTASSHHSDKHTRRIRRQEQSLAEHILQNPQPHRDFHFTGAPSPHYPPTMPLYDPYSQSGASPVSMTHTAHYAPPAAPLPPPRPASQAVGYYSPPPAPQASYPPGYGHEVAVAARPPMASSAVAQSSLAPYSPMQPPHYQVRPAGPDLSKTTIAGYELLAEKLSKGSEDNQAKSGEEAVVPMYRKFENLNHRVLLHLQDEIAELEEELRYLDECIAQCSPRDHAGRHHPASRRGDARYGGELHYRRTELLGRVYLKLGQYSKRSRISLV